MKIIRKIKNFYDKVSTMSKNSGKSKFQLTRDFFKYHKKLDISLLEYYNYEFDSKSEAFKDSFLSFKRRRQLLLDNLNPSEYGFLARNKFISHIMLEKFNIPKPNLICYYDPHMHLDDDRIGYDYNSIVSILEKSKYNSFIIKPASAAHGEGVLLVKEVLFDKNDCILLSHSGQKQLKEILNDIPLLFEEVIKQTEQFSAFNATSVNTIRMMTLLHPNGNSSLLPGFLRIGREGAVIDNAGSGGNINCEYNVETGQIVSVYEFNGWRNVNPIDFHPDNKTCINKVYIENWEEIKKQVLDFQKNIPFLKAIGWDIALTNNGPVVIEFNNLWDSTGQLFLSCGWKKEIEELNREWKNG